MRTGSILKRHLKEAHDVLKVKVVEIVFFCREQCGCRTCRGTRNVRNIIIYAVDNRSGRVDRMLGELYEVTSGGGIWNLRNILIYAVDIRSSRADVGRAMLLHIGDEVY